MAASGVASSDKFHAKKGLSVSILPISAGEAEVIEGGLFHMILRHSVDFFRYVAAGRRQEHPEADLQDVPGDLVMASGSGLDPDISLEGWLVKRLLTCWK